MDEGVRFNPPILEFAIGCNEGHIRYGTTIYIFTYAYCTFVTVVDYFIHNNS